MPMFTLHYFHASPPCRNVLITLKALNLDGIFREIDFFGAKEHLQPDFLKLNPAHSLPTLEDGNLCIWESRTIMRHLVTMNPSEKYDLYPSNPSDRVHIDRMLDFDLGTLYRSIEIYFEVYMFTEREPNNDELLKIKHNMDTLDKILEKTPFAAGNHLTIADISLAVTVTTLDALLLDYSDCKNIKKWLESVKMQLPFFDQVNSKGWQEFKNYFDLLKQKFIS